MAYLPLQPLGSCQLALPRLLANLNLWACHYLAGEAQAHKPCSATWCLTGHLWSLLQGKIFPPLEKVVSFFPDYRGSLENAFRLGT